MRIEAYYLIDSSDEQLPVWVGSAVGGGSDFRLDMKAVHTDYKHSRCRGS